jgi:DNA-binding beta-propeller fold protein YncE
MSKQFIMKNFLFGFILMVLTNQFTIAQNKFHLIKKTIIGGDGGWDYLSVDSKNQMLYVSHSTQVEVLSSRTHVRTGTISNLQGVHGVIAVSSAGRGITTNGRSNTATIFDLKTLKPLVELPTGKNPDALLYDKFSKRVFIFNHSDVTATAIDIENGKVVGTVDLGGTALEAGASDEEGTIFVNLEDASEMVSFDAKTLVVKNRWKLFPCEEPTGLAIDRKNNRLFSVCHSGIMMIVDSKNGTIISQLPIGQRVDGVVFDPKLKMAFSSNGEGSITVVQEVSANEFRVLETIATARGARTIALDPNTHHLFVSTAQFGETPTATAENPNPRPAIIANTFMVLEYGMD